MPTLSTAGLQFRMTLSERAMFEAKVVGGAGATVSIITPLGREDVEVMDETKEDELDMLFRLLTDDARLSSEDVCGFVLVVLAVKPLLSFVVPAPPPPPHALKIDITIAARTGEIWGRVKLIIRYYLLHGAAID